MGTCKERVIATCIPNAKPESPLNQRRMRGRGAPAGEVGTFGKRLRVREIDTVRSIESRTDY